MNKSSVQRCTTCILSSCFPNIEFDEKGVCNFCRNEIFFTTADDSVEKARKQIQELIKDSKGKAEYDAIMCYSGGKDSTYALMLATRKYGLKVLALTMDNGFFSNMAMQNIQNTVDYLGVDLITIRPSLKFLIPLIKISAFKQIYNPKTLVRISSVCQSCISLTNVTALKLALEKEIPFILFGFTLGQIPVNSILYKNNYKFFKESREPILKKLREHIGSQVDHYFRIDDSLLERTVNFPYNINLLCLEDPTEIEIVEKIQEFGWQSPCDVDGCSSNCRLNTFNNFIHQRKYGFNPYELEMSHLIKKGKISRKEALEKMDKQADKVILEPILEKLKIKETELDKLIGNSIL
jgi:hypothetical protein